VVGADDDRDALVGRTLDLPLEGVGLDRLEDDDVRLLAQQSLELLDLRRDVESWLGDERYSGAIARAGLPKTYQPVA